MTKESLSQMSIYKRLLFSAVVGIFLFCAVVIPLFFVSGLVASLLDYYLERQSFEFRFDINMLTGGFVLFIPAIIITSPLVFISLCFLSFFKESIQKRPAIWCILAPVLIWLFATICLVLMTDNAYYRNRTFVENFFTMLKMADSLLFLFGPIPSAIIFYYIHPVNLKKAK